MKLSQILKELKKADEYHLTKKNIYTRIDYDGGESYEDWLKNNQIDEENSIIVELCLRR